MLGSQPNIGVMVSHGIFAVIFVVVFGAATIYAFSRKMTEVGVSGVFESWRERPGKAIIVGVEFVALMLVAWRFAVSTRWAAVAWYVAGIIVAGIMVNTISRKPGRVPPSEPSRQPGEPSEPPGEIKYRRPWPPPQAEPPAQAEASIPTGSQSPGDVGHETPAPPSPPDGQPSGKLNYQAVMEWRTPVPEAYGKRVLSREHAVRYLDRTPQPLALCGYWYDPLDLPADNVAALWGLGVEKPMRCPACAKALRDAGYSLWNIDPWALGRL